MAAANDALAVEHEIQRQMLERLGIEWTPGEPFVALVEDEIRRLRNAGLRLAADSATELAHKDTEIQQLEKLLRRESEALDRALLAVDRGQMRFDRLTLDFANQLAEHQRLLAKFRAPDGWPSCPQCGQDELYCLEQAWDLSHSHRIPPCPTLRCYSCKWAGRDQRGSPT